MAEKIDSLRAWAAGRARNASGLHQDTVVVET
jgi:hypothetical protein